MSKSLAKPLTRLILLAFDIRDHVKTRRPPAVRPGAPASENPEIWEQF
jgi:hypothetical protein